MEEGEKRWMFVHGILKNVLLNAATTIGHASIGLVRPMVQGREDFKEDEVLKILYINVEEGYNSWVMDFDTKRDELTSNTTKFINAIFTIAKFDWVYGELFKRIFVRMGRSYAKIVLKIDNPEEMEQKIMKDIGRGEKK